MESLPIELISDILTNLDIAHVVIASQVCHRFRDVCSDPLLHPWGKRIRDMLDHQEDLSSLCRLSEYSVIPREVFVELLARAPPHFLLMEATLPNLHRQHWDEIINRRFLPSWRNARFERPREQFSRLLWNIWHRLHSNCTTSQAWCTYVSISRSGILNVSASYSRTYQPYAVFQELKAQSDLAHLPTEVRVIVQLADVRILVLGVLHRANSFWANKFARKLLHPPGVESRIAPSHAENPIPIFTTTSEDDAEATDETSRLFSELHPTLSRESGGSATGSSSFLRGRSWSSVTGGNRGIALFRTRSLDEQQAAPSSSANRRLIWKLRRTNRSPSEQGVVGASTLEVVAPPTPPMSPEVVHSELLPSPVDKSSRMDLKRTSVTYPHLHHPQPIPEFQNYPNFTSGGSDLRWKGEGYMEEEGRTWAGPILITAQITGERARGDPDGDMLLTHGRFAPFSAKDLFAIAPWMKDSITKVVEGPGLGL